MTGTLQSRISLPVLDKPSGVVLYEGSSNYNGDQIAVIATGLFNKSGNSKTGNVVQIWIIVANKSPLEANNQGEDEAICGTCKHRHFRSCYVNLANGPHQVWQKYHKGGYPKLQLNHATSELFRDKIVRLGAYGDPSAVPVEVWDCITRVCSGWLGYTHAWKRCDVRYRNYCMASCDTLEEAQEAMRRGWRPFYVRSKDEPLPEGFFSCPASEEAGKRMNCDRCRVCSGGEHIDGKGVPSIIAHGPSWKQSFFERGMKLMRNKEKYVGVFYVGRKDAPIKFRKDK